MTSRPELFFGKAIKSLMVSCPPKIEQLIDLNQKLDHHVEARHIQKHPLENQIEL